MRRIKIESGIIESVGYDLEACVLEVEFKNIHAVYVYENVPKQVFISMLMAESHGKYFTHHIKTSYKFKRKN